jgi:hypothetical protein
MKKLILFIGALIFIINTSVAGSSVVTEIGKSLRHNIGLDSAKPRAIVYGGQDISRPLIAIANEALWSNQNDTYVG